MQGARQQIILEFFEKLFATLALLLGSPISAVALYPLLSRRSGWRQYTPRDEQARALALREVALFLSMALGLILVKPLRLLPFDPIIETVFFLTLSFGALLLAERSASALVPRFSAKELAGPQLRNLFGWLFLGLVLGLDARTVPETLQLPCILVALVFALIPVLVASRKGEPGLLIPGAALLLAGALLHQPLVLSAALGLVLPCAVLITINLKASFASRGLVAALAAGLAGFAPPLAMPIASVLVFLLSLELWPLTLRLLVMVFLRSAYRFRIYGSQHYASDGPGLLLSNHVTLVDGFLLGAFTQRMVRFLVFDAFYKNPITRFLLYIFRTIPISQGARRDVIESLRRARTEILEGHFAGIFPEGGITRSGHLHAFQKGFSRIVSGTAIPIIPAYMNGLWGTLLSFSEQAVNLRIPRLFRSVEIEYGEPLPSSVSAAELWRAVKHLEVNAAFRDSERAAILPLSFLAAAGRYDRKPAIIANGKPLSYGELASSALLFARHVNRRLRRKKRIGVYLPDGFEKAIGHVALALAGHVAMEVPPLQGQALDDYLTAHGLGAIVTSRSWMEQHGNVKTESTFFIGRALDRFDTRDRLRTKIYRLLSPRRAWRQVCTLPMRKESAVSIVGSHRGAVVLSQRGIWSAANGARRVLWWKPGVVIHNRVPLNRAAGLLLGFWMPLLHGAAISLDAKAADFEIVDAPDWRQAHPASTHVLVVEDELQTASEEAIIGLGARYLPLFELPEASGAIALSSPAVDFQGEKQTGFKADTLGKLPFGIEMEETETGIRFRGPARSLRYLDQEEKEGQSKMQTRIDDWLSVPVPAAFGDQFFVERKSTLAPSISSTHPEHQTTSDLPDEQSREIETATPLQP